MGVVVTDATGKQTSTETEFFTSPDLLRKGLTDYSLEAGFVRLDYGDPTRPKEHLFDLLRPRFEVEERWDYDTRFRSGHLFGFELTPR